jgi:hypothetical protein
MRALTSDGGVTELLWFMGLQFGDFTVLKRRLDRRSMMRITLSIG